MSAMTARFVLIPKFCQETGYTRSAVETKIARGVWVEGREYFRAPDGRTLVDMEGFGRWVVGATPPHAGGIQPPPQ